MDTTPTPDDWVATSRSLRKLARSLTSQEADADDLAQSTMVTALTRPPRFASRAWFERVLRNRASDHRRNEKVRRERHAEHAPAEAAPSTDHIVEQLDVFRLLTEAVQELSSEQREATFLRFFDDLTPTEIAQRLDVPIKTIKTRLNRALAVLRRRIEQKRGSEWRAALLPLCTLRPEAASALPTILTTGLLMSKRVATVVAVLGLGLCSLFIVFASGSWPFGDDTTAQHNPDSAYPKQTNIETEAPVPAIADATAKEQRIEVSSKSAAEEEPAPNRPQGKLSITALWHDGTRASGVTMKISPMTGNRSPFDQQREITNAEGIAHFEVVHAGKYRLRSDRGGDTDVEVLADTTSEIEFTIEPNVDIEGSVVEASGSPVSGATIWLTSRSTRWSGASAVAKSDKNGRFHLRSIPATQSLGAAASQFAPSALVDLEDVDTSKPPAKIQLQLRKKGGDLTGIVRTATGKPSPNALVCLGKSKRHSYRIGNTEKEVWTPRTVRSDKDGRYRIPGVSPGEHPLAVLGSKHPIWRGLISIKAEAMTTQDVDLKAGVTVTGIVVDTSGTPVEDVRVGAFDIAPRLDFIQMGQIDYDEVFGYARTKTDADGRYRLDRVVPGKVILIAVESGNGEDACLSAHAELACQPGAQQVWNPILDAGRTIVGIALFRDGKPMPMHFISARNAKSGKRHTVTTNREGKFLFTNLEATSFTVSVQYWDAPKGTEPLVRDGVWPDGKEQRLTAPFDSPKKEKDGKVRGTIVDAAGRLAHRNALRMILSRGNSWHNGPKIDGMNFVFNRIKPGRVRAIVFSGEEVIGQSDWEELESGQDLDLGAITTQPGGRLRVQISRGAEMRGSAPILWAKPTDVTRSRRIELKDDIVEAGNLSSGEYTFYSNAPGMIRIDGAFTIRPGEETQLNLTLNPAADQLFVVHMPTGVGTGSMKLVIQNRAGAKVWDRNIADVSRRTLPLKTTARIPIGQYSIAAELSSGESASRQFEVRQHGKVPVIELQLK